MMSNRKFAAAMLLSPVVAVALVLLVVGCSPEQQKTVRDNQAEAAARETRNRAYLRQTRIVKVCDLHGGVFFVYRGPDDRLFLSPYRNATRHYDRLDPFGSLEPISPGIRINEVC